MSSCRAVVYLAFSSCLVLPGVSFAADDRPELGEEISVTATRAPRRTRDVPQAISVVGKDVIDDKVAFNVKDVVTGTPGVLIDTKNGGYDARLIIRGAGLKAAYGVREIMLLRDGVPLTDPDSFSRLDWVDTQDIERVEISKGPGNLFSPGTAGGAIQIISRSVFDGSSDVAQVGGGTHGALDLHLRKSTRVAEHGLALTGSYRRQENDWRTRNGFDSLQLGLKHGVRLGESGTVESEVAFTMSNLQLPGAMNAAQFGVFQRTGEQTESADPWKHSGRYSRIVFLNTKLEQPLGELTLRPRVYYNQWAHLHPVTGAINETQDWNHTLGTDLEAQHRHGVWAAQGTFVGGITAKGQWTDDTRKYQYRDVVLSGGRITATRSDAKGALMEIQGQRTLLAGVFAQETIQAGRVTVDVGGRFDHSWMRTRSDQRSTYNYATGRYSDPATTPRTITVTEKQFELPAPKVGVSVRLTELVSVFGSVAQGSQVPSDSEILSNASLSPSRSTNYELGVKARAAAVTLDASAYWNDVADEIVSYLSSGVTAYQNAGRTRKLGVEASASVRLPARVEVGASYAYSDYTYVHFTERGTSANLDGNRLPYVPLHQYGAFAAWSHPSGFRLRVQANTWGRYWIDNANTATYHGYEVLTSLGAAWRWGRSEAILDAQNVLDQRYAAQVSRDATARSASFSAGTPRTVLLSYRFHL
jgi:iron complex outermembrane receptor protein